jgi:hypothetical protein
MCNFVHPLESALLVKDGDRQFACRVKKITIFNIGEPIEASETMIVYENENGYKFDCHQVIKRIDIPISLTDN